MKALLKIKTSKKAKKKMNKNQTITNNKPFSLINLYKIITDFRSPLKAKS